MCASVFKIIGKYTKTEELKFISHLDVLRLVQRAISRAELPAKYSEGFNPHMKLSFGYPLSLGIESVGEYFELELLERVPEKEIVEKLNKVLPPKVRVLAVEYYEGKDSLMTMCKYSQYSITIDCNNLDYEKLEKLIEVITNEGLVVVKEKKNKPKNKVKKKEINTNEIITKARVLGLSDNSARIDAVFRTSGDGGIKIADFIKLLEDNGIGIQYYSTLKIESLDENSKPIINTKGQ